MADNEDCRRKHFLVLSTFNEERQQEGQPTLLIPGHPAAMQTEDKIFVPPNTDPDVVAMEDMVPFSLDSLMRSLDKVHWKALANSPEAIVTDAATLARIFRTLDGTGKRRELPDLWLSLQAVKRTLFMRAPDPSSDKVPRVRAAEAAVLSSALAPCPRAPTFKRVVRYRMAHIELYDEDSCVALANPVACVPDPLGGDAYPFAPFADSHNPWANPLREHKTDPANPMGETESGPDLHHVRAVSNKAHRNDYDAGLYFSGCHEAQTFWAPAGKGGGGYVGGPEVTRPDQGRWEMEKADTLRAFVDELDDIWFHVCGDAWENPGAQAAWLCRKVHRAGLDEVDFPPCLVSAHVCDELVEMMREGPEKTSWPNLTNRRRRRREPHAVEQGNAA